MPTLSNSLREDNIISAILKEEEIRLEKYQRFQYLSANNCLPRLSGRLKTDIKRQKNKVDTLKRLMKRDTGDQHAESPIDQFDSYLDQMFRTLVCSPGGPRSDFEFVSIIMEALREKFSHCITESGTGGCFYISDEGSSI